MAEFDVGTAYTRADIYELLVVPEEKQGGAWNRGYREWDGEMFIFATVGVGTTSGFDYLNALHPDGSMTWTQCPPATARRSRLEVPAWDSQCRLLDIEDCNACRMSL